MSGRFNKPELTLFREKLEAIIAECKSGLDNPNSETGTVDLEQSIGRVTRIDSLARQQMAMATQRRLKTLLVQATSALERLEAGTYGDCQECSDEISFDRLKHTPSALYCVSCQENKER